MRRSLVLSSLLVAACSDYDLTAHKQQDDIAEDDTGFEPDTDDGDLGYCGDPDLDPREVGTNEDCKTEPITGTFTPVIEWTNTAVGDAYSTPIVGQLTDDNGNGMLDSGDTPDVVVSNAVGVTYALSGDTGTIIWQAGNLGAEPMTPALGDLDGDGWNEVVASGINGTMAFNGTDGAVKWRGTAFAGTVSAYCGAVGVYDLDADGIAEVVIGSQILNGATGVQIAKGSGGDGSGHGWAAPMGVAADIDRDGKLEVVVGNALFDAKGKTIWNNRLTDGFVAVGNFDGDDKGEIVVSSVGGIRLQDDDGTVLWQKSRATGDTIGTPTIADFDGDGEPEIGVAGHDVYAVFEGNGATKWTKAVADASSGFTGSSVFDFEGDGAAEVVYADENDVYVLDGATGAVKMKETRHSSATCSEYPAVADVDGDGHAEIVYTSSAYSGSERGVTVIGDADDSWMASRPVWNQHSYAITNVEDDGGIPAVPDVNWDTYNNFRSGDLASATGGVSTDAVPVLNEICDEECESGLLRVTVAVGNQGLSDLPAGVPITLYSKGVALGTEWTTDVVVPGATSPGIVFSLDPALVGNKLQVMVDDDGASGLVSECLEDNNSLDVTSGLCK